MASHSHQFIQQQEATDEATSSEQSNHTQHRINSNGGIADHSKQTTEDNKVILSDGAASVATHTEHTATTSLSMSPRSRSSSSASNGKSTDDISDSTNCFVCMLRLQENVELEQRLRTYREIQQNLEDDIVVLAEKAETSAAEFETLAALYHADQKDLHERLHLLEVNNSMLEKSVLELEDKNLTLTAELDKSGATAEYRKLNQDEAVKGDANLEDVIVMQHHLQVLQNENAQLRSSTKALEEEKRSLEDCLQRGAQRSREIRKGRRILQEEMSSLRSALEMKAAEHRKQAAVSLAEKNRLENRLQLLENENLNLARSVNDLIAEKGVLEMKLNKANAIVSEFQGNQAELEAKIKQLQHEATVARRTDFDSLSVLSFDARNDIAEQFKLVEEESSVLQRSVDFLEKENAVFEAKIQEAEARATLNETLAHSTHENERRLLRDRIMELVREKGVIVGQYDNALNLTKTILAQMETQVQTFEVELFEERKACHEAREEMILSRFEVERQSQLAEARLLENNELNIQLVSVVNELRQREIINEKMTDAYEAELERRGRINSETEAMNTILSDDVATLTALLNQYTNTKEMESFLEQTRSEADWYRQVAKGYEEELSFLQQVNSEQNEEGGNAIEDYSICSQTPISSGPIEFEANEFEPELQRGIMCDDTPYANAEVHHHGVAEPSVSEL